MAFRSFVTSRLLGMALATSSLVPLSACSDDPHFDAQQYQIVVSSTYIRDYTGGGAFTQSENYLFKLVDYLPGFCSSSTTTPGNGDRTVAIDWQSCVYGGESFVGELEYVGDGQYEGLVAVTTSSLTGAPVTFDVWFSFVPVKLESE